MILLRLFIEFFKIGLFAIGGGMATIPFLRQLSLSTGWFPPQLITDMIAISESTPGPIGINMATYVGYNIAGPAGGIAATLGEILPAIIIVTLVSKSLEKFSNNKQIDHISVSYTHLDVYKRQAHKRSSDLWNKNPPASGLQCSVSPD